MNRQLFLRGAFRGFGHFVDRSFGFCTKNLQLFGFGFCCGMRFLLYFALNFQQNKIGFSDLLFGDVVWCFSGLSSENMRLNDLNHGHVFSDFACGFRF